MPVPRVPVRVAARRSIRVGHATAAMRRPRRARVARRRHARVTTILRRLLQARPQRPHAAAGPQRNTKQRHVVQVIRFQTAVASSNPVRAVKARVTLVWRTAARRDRTVGPLRQREIIPVRRHVINARQNHARAATARQRAVPADRWVVRVGRVPSQAHITGRMPAIARRAAQKHVPV
jgi:hypothetical protein